MKDTVQEHDSFMHRDQLNYGAWAHRQQMTMEINDTHPWFTQIAEVVKFVGDRPRLTLSLNGIEVTYTMKLVKATMDSNGTTVITDWFITGSQAAIAAAKSQIESACQNVDTHDANSAPGQND